MDPAALYNAFASGDPRFDGVFYVGVTSTGIYCRPVCTARTPRAANCRFFNSAEAAEKARFRPCLRCRPELAPGSAPVDDAHRIAAQIAERIEEGAVGEEMGLEQLAGQFGLSSRQVRRIVRSEFGVSPIELVQTRRLLLAKHLLTDTALPIIDVAFASGFGSLRRFNDAFRGRYGMPPTRLRRQVGGAAGPDEALRLRLAYRPPFDWPGILTFLRDRALRGVEAVDAESYLRTARLGAHEGWFRVVHEPERRSLGVEIAPSLAPALPALLARVRHLFDLTARPDVISARLGEAPLLSESVQRNPGLRVPGAFEGFEMAARAILGQQVTVRAATTLSGRFCAAFGEAAGTPFPEVTHFSPTPQRVAAASVDEIASLGIIGSRARTLIALAEEVAAGRLKLHAGAHPERVMEQLTALPGIGPWTAHYIAMRALRWPDAFPKEDIAVRNALGRVSSARAEDLSRPWSPWRSYATLHLWRGLTRAE